MDSNQAHDLRKPRQGWALWFVGIENPRLERTEFRHPNLCDRRGLSKSMMVACRGREFRWPMSANTRTDKASRALAILAIDAVSWWLSLAEGQAIDRFPYHDPPSEVLYEALRRERGLKRVWATNIFGWTSAKSPMIASLVSTPAKNVVEVDLAYLGGSIHKNSSVPPILIFWETDSCGKDIWDQDPVLDQIKLAELRKKLLFSVSFESLLTEYVHAYESRPQLRVHTSDLEEHARRLVEHFTQAVNAGVSQESRRLVKQYERVYEALFCKARRYELSELSGLQQSTSQLGVTITFRSVNLKKDFTYELRGTVTAAEFAAALAQAHFPKESSDRRAWLIADAAGNVCNPAWPMGFVKRQIGSVVYLTSIFLNALPVYAPDSVFQIETRSERLMRLLRKVESRATVAPRSLDTMEKLVQKNSLFSPTVRWTARYERLCNLAWALAENDVNVGLAHRIVNALHKVPGSTSDARFCDIAAWVYYRQGRYAEALATQLEGMSLAQQAVPRWCKGRLGLPWRVIQLVLWRPIQWEPIRLYHLYFIHRQMNDTTLADQVRKSLLWMQTDDELSRLACHRVVQNNDSAKCWS